MTARKKSAKKTASRSAKTPKRTVTAAKSAKNSASRTSKASKPLTKLEKAALAAKQKAKTKAAAKSAKTSAEQVSAKTAVKQAVSASKTARPPVKHKIEAEAKIAGGVPSVKTPPMAHEVKESEELNAAKIKTEAKTPAPTIKTLTAAKTAATVGKKPEAGEGPRAAAPTAQPAKPIAASPVVPLQGIAKPARPAATEAAPAARAEEPAAPKPAKPAAPRHGFKAHEFVVYPAHGVGQIVAIEEQEVAGFRLELFVITFVKDKMMLRVPVGKAASVGMRKLSDPDLVKKSLDTLLGRARIKRTMWSRRAQEYEAKINSGDLIAIAEVVRDLYRSEAQPEQSYSERQLYEAALDRMAREVAVVQRVDEAEGLKLIEGQLQKGQRGRKAEAAPAGDADNANDSDVEEAA